MHQVSTEDHGVGLRDSRSPLVVLASAAERDAFSRVKSTEQTSWQISLAGGRLDMAKKMLTECTGEAACVNVS